MSTAKQSGGCKADRERDLGRLYELMKALIGKKCQRVGFSYGGELCLHFGPLIHYTSNKLAGQKKGSWIFGTRGTAWQIETSRSSISSKDLKSTGEERLEKRLSRAIENTKVTGFGVFMPQNGLEMRFANGSTLRVLPTEKDARSDLPYWELFMPEHKLIVFGPDNAWSCIKSGESAKTGHSAQA